MKANTTIWKQTENEGMKMICLEGCYASTTSC